MRKIIHIDMDYFYAQVEERDNPKLKGHPVAIGGLMGGRGVLATSNYIARKYGVKAAMPTRMALKLCPDLILVGGDFSKYREASSQIFEVFRLFTDKIERLSLDEAYLDVTDCEQFNNNAIAIAYEIKRLILERTKLTASAGVSYNKLLAKIGSDLFKPNGLSVLRPNNIEKNISHFEIKKISGVGKVTQERMKKLNIYTFGDLQTFTKLDLINMFGDFGSRLHGYCRGIDTRKVESGGERKSLSVEHTFSVDIAKEAELLVRLRTAYDEMNDRLEKHTDRIVKTIVVKVKFHDFTSTTIESQRVKDFENYVDLLKHRITEHNSKPVRLIGVGVKFYSSQTEGQLEFNLNSDSNNVDG